MTTQEDFMLFKQYNAQVNAITNQKNQLKYVMEDFNKALEEVKKTKGNEIYKNLGIVVIKKDKKDIEEEINKEIEVLNVRIKTLEKQEDIMTKKLNELKAKIEANMPKENKK